MTFEPDNNFESGVVIRVIGVGGGGNNAVNRMIAANIRGVEFVSVNTDRQALRKSEAPAQMVIGEKITRGFGAGANPEVGARAAEESLDEIKQMLAGADMVFVAAGMGGGTGTGAAPIVARVAHEMGILTVGIVTKPFNFEGKRRMTQAENGIKELRQYVDSLVVIPNEKLNQVSDTRITLGNAFEIADDVLRRGVQSISELINVPGFINLDFADVTSVMKNAGYAHMGVGGATGPEKASRAAAAAITSPLLETSIHGARGILISITASRDVGLEDVDLASSMISKEAHPDANVIWGLAFDDSLDDEMRVTIIATGFENEKTEAVEVTEDFAPIAKEAPVTNEQAESIADISQPMPQETSAIVAEQSTTAVETQQSKAPEVTHAPAFNTAEEEEDGDDFDRIMNLFRSKAQRNDF